MKTMSMMLMGRMLIYNHFHQFKVVKWMILRIISTLKESFDN